jgi:UDP-N-acetylenolpyruvoylglucosamine reductase
MFVVRLSLVLAGALAALLSIIALRAETTRMNYEQSQLDQRAELLLQEVREKELELARLRNPALIRQRVEEMLMRRAEPEPGRERPAARPNRP